MNDAIKTISRGTTDMISRESLEKKLIAGKPLRVKAGFDPTAPDIHLGHVVLLRKLRQFQDLGHKVLFLIGDFTALVGDPTGRNELRPALDLEFVRANAETYTRQALKILDDDPDKLEVVYNFDWLNDLGARKMLELTAYSTVAQMLARSDFKKRYESGTEISIMEFLYPLLQGYDSFHLHADIEVGGNDQKFNLLMGRQIQESLGQKPQDVVMTPLLEGLDGVKKMSKSLDNYIGIDEPAAEILGKIMSISDDLMMRYYEVLTEDDLERVQDMHPKDAKLQLGERIVEQFYTAEDAVCARREFERVFAQKELPDDMPEYVLTGKDALLDILSGSGMASSRNEARRLLKQGAVSSEGEAVREESWEPRPGVLKIGKRRFLRLTAGEDR
ncbi:MAG: tyrosine--tRNA ligase [Candidatus Omnitrophota bacterium]